MNFITTIGQWFVAGALVLASMLGLHQIQPQQNQPQTFGSYFPTGGGTYRLGQSIGTSDTTIKLSSFKEPVSNIPYTMSYLNSDIEYATLSPQSSISEFISFAGITQNSDGSATLTGVVRGLSRSPGTGGCVASTTLAQSHAGQSILILSNPPCQLAEYAPLRTTATSSAVLVFGSTTQPRYDANPSSWQSANSLVNKAYADSLTINGAPTSTESTLGTVVLSNIANTGSSTASSSTQAPIVIENKFATTTPGTLCTNGGWSCIVATIAGKIKQSFLDLTQSFTFSGGLTSTATSTFTGSNVNSNALVINGLPYAFGGSRAASNTVLTESGTGNLTFEPVQAMSLAVSTTTNIAMGTASTTFSSTASHLHVVLYLAGWANASAVTCFRFNNDVGATYTSTQSDDNVLQKNAATNQIVLGAANGTSSPAYFNIDITNVSGTRKFLTWQGTSNNSGANSPHIYSGSGIWNNTSAQISSLNISDCSGSSNLSSGSFIGVYTGGF